MRTIRIKFSGFGGKFNDEDNFIINILKKYYNVEISGNPEYFFYSVFSKDYLKYDCVRIYYTGENLCPDFNLCDYGIGFDYINFGDRYLRYPLFLLSDYTYSGNDDIRGDLSLALKKHEDIENKIKEKSGFCCFVYSNNKAAKIREEFYKKLSSYKKIDSGGRIMNNIGGPVENKLEFQKKYKFCIAFENSSSSGYTTEKIMQAFAANTVPIYWGDPDINKVFNYKSFINVSDFNNLEDAIDHIKFLDLDDEAYLSMLKEPVFLDCNYIVKMNIQLEEFLKNLINKPYEMAFQRKREFWGKRYARRVKIGDNFYHFVKSIYMFFKRR